MPARKDFFHLHGSEDVPGMEYLNWREFLRYNGSKARRRDRVLLNKDNTHAIYTVIYRELLACLRIAGLYKQTYAVNGNDEAKRLECIKLVIARAKDAILAIFLAAGYFDGTQTERSTGDSEVSDE